MTLKVRNVCRFCKVEMSLDKLVVQCRTKGREYYTCRECNRLRLLKYRATNYGKEAVRRARIKSTKKHSYKQNARSILAQAIRYGRIVKPSKCSICGMNKDVQGHHEDYSKPLEVIWLCRWCHIEADKLLKM